MFHLGVTPRTLFTVNNVPLGAVLGRRNRCPPDMMSLTFWHDVQSFCFLLHHRTQLVRALMY
jgi:hypothetical protein